MLFFSIVFCISAKETIVSGNAKDYAGQELVLKAYLDEIVFNENELASSIVDEDGNFSFEIALPATITCFLSLGTYQAFFFLSPDIEYSISLPPFTPLTQAQQMNPYFRPEKILLPIETTDKNDVNNLILNFDEAFEYYYTMGIFYHTSTDSLRTFENTLQDFFQKTNNGFFEDYKDYKYAQLINLNERNAPTLAIKSYMSKLSADYGNIAFWEAFNLIFDNFFTVFRGKTEQNFFDNALNSNDYAAMLSVLENRFEIKDEVLQELVIVKALYDFYYFKKETQLKAFTLMNEWRKYIKSPRNTRILNDIIIRLEKNFTIQKAYDFSLPDENEQYHSLSDYKGKFVYLNFCNTAISLSKKDFAILKRYADTYSKDLYVINIFTDNDSKALKTLTGRQKGKMINLYWNNERDLISSYKIINIPTYFLIDRDGNLLLSPAPTPDQNFEESFEKILFQEKSKEPVIQPEDVWW
ncbi:MAG: TlpA family protein disulfide reductase [Bacteroidales bacterium]|nr:TlpA family protein disulfide reductase [Bacteroidales bacterium]